MNILNHSNNIRLIVFRNSRGTGADLPIQSNEAMASQWKGGLINHLYLLHGHDEGDVQTLVMRVFLLGFCFKLLVPTQLRWNNHYHEIGTERAIIPVKVCGTSQKKQDLLQSTLVI